MTDLQKIKPKDLIRASAGSFVTGVMRVYLVTEDTIHVNGGQRCIIFSRSTGKRIDGLGCQNMAIVPPKRRRK